MIMMCGIMTEIESRHVKSNTWGYSKLGNQLSTQIIGRVHFKRK
jgi:hypothetical protein